MVALYSRALLAWLSLFELVALARGWQGLRWGPNGMWRALLLLPLVLLARGTRQRPVASVAALLASFGPALSAQLLLALWRNRHLDPSLPLMPGTPGRRVEAFDIPLAEGHVPALHIAPLGGARACVVVVHGSGCNKTFYAWRLVDELLTRGMAVLLFDLDGHGANPQFQRWPGTEQTIWATVGFARARYAVVGLIGYSLGGCLAAHAVAHGLVVDALVVAEAPPRLQFDQRAVQREALALLRPAFWHVLRDSSLYHFVRVWRPTNIRCTIGTHDLIAALDLPGSLARITTPLLLVYGGSDAIVPLDQAQVVRKAAPPQAVYHEATAASHLSMILDGDALVTMGVWLEETLLRHQDQLATN